MGDELCSSVVGDQKLRIRVVNIAAASIVRWLEVPRKYNSTIGKNGVCARSSRCGMEKWYDIRPVVDDLYRSVAGDKKLRMQVVDMAAASILRWLEVVRNYNSTIGKSGVCAHSSRCGIEKR